MTDASSSLFRSTNGGAVIQDSVMLHNQQAQSATDIARAAPLPAKHRRRWLALLVIALLTAAVWPPLSPDHSIDSTTNYSRAQAVEGRVMISPFTDESGNLLMP
jgi:ferric-dicitrate binding protein FerR (iron transport regulator)